MENKKIFWLSSYPKSGNTWIRAIISSLFFTTDGVFNFNLLKNFTVFDQESKYDFIKEINEVEYRQIKKLNILSKYRIEAQKRAFVGGDFAFFKTHSSNISINENFYTNETCTRGIIYLIRDPRDVVISYSKHIGCSIDETIDIMTNETEVNYYYSMPYLMSRWDLHYKSWPHLKVPKVIIKYEDLVDNIEKNFDLLINFFSKNYGFVFNNIDKIKKNILSSTSFDSLKKLENFSGFEESTKHTKFFRVGKSNQWNKILNDKQENKISCEFKEIMKEFNYL